MLTWIHRIPLVEASTILASQVAWITELNNYGSGLFDYLVRKPCMQSPWCASNLLNMKILDKLSAEC